MMRRLLRGVATLIFGGLIFIGDQPAISGEDDYLLAPGIAAMEQLEFGNALALFQQAANQAPNDPKLLYAIGNAHAALGHDALAALYSVAYLTAWSGAPKRESTKAEIQSYALKAYEKGREMVALAADMAQNLPEESRIGEWPEFVSDKQRVVARVISDLVMVYDNKGAEGLARAYPIGATMALGGAAGKFAETMHENVIASEVLGIAERIAILEANSPDVHIFASLDTNQLALCTFPDEPCPDGAIRFDEPPSELRIGATLGVLQIGLSTWAHWIKRPSLEKRLFDEGSANFRAVLGSGGRIVNLSGILGGYSISLDGDGQAYIFYPDAKYQPAAPNGFLEEFSDILNVTDAQQAILRKEVPTGMTGEAVSLDDLLLTDQESFMIGLADLPPNEAILALSNAGRQLVMLADRIRAP